MENFIGVYDNVLPLALCDKLIDFFIRSPSKITRNHEAKKNTEFYPLPDPIVSQLTYLLSPVLKTYAENHIALARYQRFQYENFVIKKYIPGDFHTWHTDATSDTTFRRFLAIQCYLNTVEDGGCTEFSTPEKLSVSPIAGRVVFFPAGWTHLHRGAPPVSGPKYSMNSYLMFPRDWLVGGHDVG